VSNKLLVKARPGKEIASVTPESAGWGYVGFAAYRLQPGESVFFEDPAREACLVIISGRARVQAGDIDCGELGTRKSVFDSKAPDAAYVPNNCRVSATAVTECEIAIAHAPGFGTYPARVIPAASIRRSVRGEGTNQRFVTDILPADQPADSLLVVEVITPSSHSSSYPPHKHDMDDLPNESSLEETYYHRLNPPQGYALQRVYTDDRSLDEAVAAEDHDVVMVPRGYHPVTVPHGYTSYYLNVMAGEKRNWVFRNDPAHEWMLKKA
jgi:5-deoxy-glucuronate isomerase